MFFYNTVVNKQWRNKALKGHSSSSTVNWGPVFIPGISPGEIPPANVEFPRQKGKRKGRGREDKGKDPRKLLIPPGCEESRV